MSTLKAKLTLTGIFLLFIFNYAFAQSHNLQAGSSCMFAKNRCSTGDCTACPACGKKKDENKKAEKAEDQRRIDERIVYGALAIDRENGFYYGWSYDYATREEAEKRSVEECEKKGGECSVVLTYLGAGCAAYRTIDGKVGTAFGWGVARTKEEADEIAKKECMKRSKGAFPANNVWSCNSQTKLALKEIYNAKDEIADVVDTLIKGTAHSVKFSPDGKKVAVGNHRGIIRIYAMPSFSLLRIIDADAGLKSYEPEIHGLTFSPDGRYLACGVVASQFMVFDVTTGQLVTKIKNKAYRRSAAVCFSPDGKTLATGSDCQWSGGSCPGEIYLWSADTWELKQTLTGLNFNPETISFSPDGQKLAAPGMQGMVYFWDLTSGNMVKEFRGNDPGDHPDWTHYCHGIFSPKGQTYATISVFGDKKVKLWNAATGSLAMTLGQHPSYPESLAYFPDGDMLLSIDSKSLKVWDATSGATVYNTETPYSYSVDVSPNGTHVVVGCNSQISLYSVSPEYQLTLIKELKDSPRK
jgi:WD40 repeat protein